MTRLATPLTSVAALAVAALTVAGCTASPARPAPTITSTQIETITRPPSTSTIPSSTAAGPPISTGPTTAASASACPYLVESSAQDKIGMRLGRITVLHSSGKVVGCRYYAVQGTSFNQSEHLPPANQPAIEITTSRYGSAIDAHNALVTLAQSGASAQQERIAAGNTGLCFQIAFYSADHGKDWACAFSVGSTLVLVKTVVTNSFDAIQIAIAIAPRFHA